MRAMVVDDSKAMRTVLKRLLSEFGYTEILEVGSGPEGLDAMDSADPPELALVDGNMAEMSGIDFVEAVRARAEWNDVLLMLMTTQTSVDEETLTVATDEHLVKPFTKDALFEKLEIVRRRAAPEVTLATPRSQAGG
jgi:two-component system, chemotaxis family, chemotaxis protein CheY